MEGKHRKQVIQWGACYTALLFCVVVVVFIWIYVAASYSSSCGRSHRRYRGHFSVSCSGRWVFECEYVRFVCSFVSCRPLTLCDTTSSTNGGFALLFECLERLQCTQLSNW